MLITKTNTHTSDNLNLFSDKIYWLNKLAGELPETNIITDYVRPQLYRAKNKSIEFELNNYLSQAVIKLSKSSYYSIYLLLLSAFNIVLERYTGNNDLIVGIPIYRPEGIENSNNTILPLRINLTKELTFKDLLIQVKNNTIETYIHQNYSFDELVNLLKLSPSHNRHPIFDIVVLLENIHNYDQITKSNNDLTLSFIVNGHSIRGKIDYSESLFQEETIKLISKYYINVIECVVNQPQIKISDVTFLKEEDQYQLLENFHDNRQAYPIKQTINQLFEKQVEHTPDNIAVVCKDTKLTYQELNAKANQLAVFLQKLGLKKGEFVGIFKDRDINFLIAILAIYKAGGAYIPIDSTYPLNRIKYMLSNSEITFLLTDYFSLNILPEVVASCSKLKYITCLDVKPHNLVESKIAKVNVYDQLDFHNLPQSNLEVINEAIDPAYILYTSGSTGLPKGAIVRHDGAINHIYAQFDQLELGEEFTFLQSAPSSTDISVWQFLAPLLIGGKTVIVDIETVAFAEKLFKVLKSAQVTAVELVPALFKVLLEYSSQLSLEERELPDLQWMILSGESIAIRWINKWLEIYPQIKIANAYGPTEAADDITQFIVDQPISENQRTIPIGKPLANLNLYVLDRSMQLLPIGAPGEICVSGIGVGDGYWKNEAKTKASFVANPFNNQLLDSHNHDVIYKTGDLGRWLTDGNIEFLGRIDHQVKIRGFRIELGEIEACLSQHSNVRENIVVTHQEETGVQLIAYLVAKEESVPTVKELRSFLKEKLPDHMIPSAFIMLKRLPIAPSGKIDRQALPAPEKEASREQEYVAPSNQSEEIIVKIFASVLDLKNVGILDNFFELGGHSLSATQVISRLRQEFEIEFPLRILFEKPTVAQLATYITTTNQVLEQISRSPIPEAKGRKKITL